MHGVQYSHVNATARKADYSDDSTMIFIYIA